MEELEAVDEHAEDGADRRLPQPIWHPLGEIVEHHA